MTKDTNNKVKSTKHSTMISMAQQTNQTSKAAAAIAAAATLIWWSRSSSHPQQGREPIDDIGPATNSFPQYLNVVKSRNQHDHETTQRSDREFGCGGT
jgi:hypothetical protein